jgi:hypothetical protein
MPTKWRCRDLRKRNIGVLRDSLQYREGLVGVHVEAFHQNALGLTDHVPRARRETAASSDAVAGSGHDHHGTREELLVTRYASP